MEQIPHSKPWITDLDIEVVTGVLASSMLAQGERVRMLEKRLASWVNATDAVGIGCGSAAIVLALHGLSIGKGDEVILPTYVCPSVLEAILSADATPVLCDVSRNWVMTVAEAEHVMSSKTRAIIVPHMYGIFTDIESFRTLGVPLIEDCAQAVDSQGARPTKADVTVFSFHPTKCLTSGEGGMAVSSDEVVLQRMRAYRDGSKTGYGARLFSPLSDVSAGLALSQLDRYEEGLVRRREIATRYIEVLETCCPSVINREALERSMFFRFPLRIQHGLVACQQAFLERGIHVKKGVDYLLHRGMGRSDHAFRVAAELFDTTVSIPIYPALSNNQELRCIEALSQILTQLH